MHYSIARSATVPLTFLLMSFVLPRAAINAQQTATNTSDRLETAAVTYFYRANGHRLQLDLKHDDLDGKPKWDPHRPNPPVSASDEIAKAKEIRKQLHQAGLLSDDKNDWDLEDWELESLRLCPIDVTNGVWYWLVVFDTKDAMTGPANQFGVVVLLNGDAIAPTVSKE